MDASSKSHSTETGRNWVAVAIGVPIVCGIAYAAWSLFRPSTVQIDAWTTAYGLVVGAVSGGVVGCAAFIGGSCALRILETRCARAVGRGTGILIFAFITGLIVGLTVFLLFALSNQAASAVGPTASVVGFEFLVSLAYGQLAVRGGPNRTRG